MGCSIANINSTIVAGAYTVNGGCWGGTYLSAVNNPCIDQSSAQMVECGTFCAVPKYPGKAGVMPTPDQAFTNGTAPGGWFCVASEEKAKSAGGRMELGRMGALVVLAGVVVSVMGAL